MSNEQESAIVSSLDPIPTANRKRKPLLIGLSAAVALATGVYGAYWALIARHFESTDDAYVAGNIVQITPQVAGTVIAIKADDTDYVQSGEPLVTLDPADADVGLAQVEAQLAQTVREVRIMYVNNNALAATTAMREADVKSAEAELAKARDDLARRQSLGSSGAVSAEDLQHARNTVKTAQSALNAAQAAAVAAREQLASNRSLTEGATVNEHPNVKLAAARVREAYIAKARTELPAPVSGYVAKRSVQVGQRVEPGAPLLAIIPLDQVWVDANFKEAQLRDMRIGQPVRLSADLYGGKIEYHGHIAGLGAGTGAAFALLPAQNATGNWIKVVQRVPVRITLDAAEVSAHPLRLGLSMQVKVDVHDQSGPALASATRASSIQTTAVFDALRQQAEAEVERIVSANLNPGADVSAAQSNIPASAEPKGQNGAANHPPRKPDAGDVAKL
ncbi:MAG: efflux RND transporter periplasmic adaptor subunit [Gammaproteobacteria bacterium]